MKPEKLEALRDAVILVVDRCDCGAVSARELLAEIERKEPPP